MKKKIEITVENKLVTEERDINVYHNSTGSAHIISCHSCVSRPLRVVDSGDYLHISAVSGPGPLRGVCRVDLPSWVDFEFDSGSGLDGKVTLTHSRERTVLNIPPGSPTWHVKVTRPMVSFNNQLPEHITVSDSPASGPH
ncbi:MAG: hypothetical protein GY940_29530 [bacterium]|nr:hypothetical protein [bacterium]